MTNMAQNKELYKENGEKWVMETNDFKYYMHLKRLKIPFSKLLTILFF